MSEAQPLTLTLEDGSTVSALLHAPRQPRAAYVFAHGAGAGMTHTFMAAVSAGLAKREIACLRYQFPYMEKGSKRPDVPAVAHTAVRAAVEEAVRRLPGVPLVAGGKSFGGRMSSQAQAMEPMHGVLGLVFFGFPLHPAEKPSQERAVHLEKVECPMLFLQGTRDELATFELITEVVDKLGDRATLMPIEEADHSFHVPAKTGRKDAEVLEGMLDVAAEWIGRLP